MSVQATHTTVRAEALRLAQIRWARLLVRATWATQGMAPSVQTSMSAQEALTTARQQVRPAPILRARLPVLVAWVTQETGLFALILTNVQAGHTIAELEGALRRAQIRQDRLPAAAMLATLAVAFLVVISTSVRLTPIIAQALRPVWIRRDLLLVLVIVDTLAVASPVRMSMNAPVTHTTARLQEGSVPTRWVLLLAPVPQATQAMGFRALMSMSAL